MLLRFRNAAALTASLGLAAVAAASACGGGASTPTLPSSPPPGENVAVELRNFAFVPATFEFARGERVNFTLHSVDIQHTFTVQGLPIDWVVNGGRTVTQSYTFDRTGEFLLVCTISGHRQAGMEGTIVVR
jgi:plastocyanin